MSIADTEKKTIPLYETVVTKENLYRAWNDFIREKRKRADVNIFALHLIDNLSELHDDLLRGRYRHGAYEAYEICDPKKRSIHKASVRDRIVHRLVYNALYPYFNKRFVHDSYSCRTGKGTHKARDRFRVFANRVSFNYTKPCHVLTFDIKKCFESIDQEILLHLLDTHIRDERLRNILRCIVGSFRQGLPLGNLTSQLFINIYLHELDHYMKHVLKVEYYIRYADDMAILHHSPKYLQERFSHIDQFLTHKLLLSTHKVQVQSLTRGVDVLGELFFPTYKRLRRSTERRMLRRQRRD